MDLSLNIWRCILICIYACLSSYSVNTKKKYWILQTLFEKKSSYELKFTNKSKNIAAILCDSIKPLECILCIYACEFQFFAKKRDSKYLPFFCLNYNLHLRCLCFCVFIISFILKLCLWRHFLDFVGIHVICFLVLSKRRCILFTNI